MTGFEMSCDLPAPPDRVFDAVRDPQVMRHVAGGLIKMTPITPLPERWKPGTWRIRLHLFGLIPLGWQEIGVSFPATTPPLRALNDTGRSPLFRLWEHRITVAPSHVGTRYTDKLSIDAGRVTPLALPLLRLFFVWRQYRLRRLFAKAR